MPAVVGRRRRAGMTLIELLLSVALVALIASALAGLVYSAAHGSAEQDRGVALLVGGQAGLLKLKEALTCSRGVLARGDDYLVLWTHDADDVEHPNLSELLRIERDPETNELYCYTPAAGMDTDEDTQYGVADTDFAAVTAALKGTEGFPGVLWSTDVTGFTTAVDDPELSHARFVTCRVTIMVDGNSETHVVGAALSNAPSQ